MVLELMRVPPETNNDEFACDTREELTNDHAPMIILHHQYRQVRIFRSYLKNIFEVTSIWATPTAIVLVEPELRKQNNDKC